MSEDFENRLLDYHYRAFQAHSKAQKFYLLSLVVFVVYVWLSYFFGGDEILKPPWINVHVTKRVLVGGSPAIIAVFLWGLMGAIKRAGESVKEFKKILRNIEPKKADMYTLHKLDLHPNLLDYAADLTGRKWAQLLYPLVHLVGLISILVLGVIFALGQVQSVVTRCIVVASYLVLDILVYAPWHHWIRDRVRRFREMNVNRE